MNSRYTKISQAPCPKCGAEPHMPCNTGTRPALFPHQERVDLAVNRGYYQP